MNWIRSAAFAKIVGCSASNVSQAINNGRIKPEHVRKTAACTYINTAAMQNWQATSKNPSMPPLAWGAPICQDAVANKLNEYLGADWPAPPWSAEQVQTLMLCLEMAQED